MITSVADIFSVLCISTGIPLPLSDTLTELFLLIFTIIVLQKPAKASSIELSTTSKIM